MDFIARVKEKARELNKSIVFPESLEDRTLLAVKIITDEETAHPILLGDEKEIKAHAVKAGADIDWNKVTIINMEDPDRTGRYAKALFEIRKDKGLSREAARELLKDPNYFGTMMVQLSEADGMISGAASPSGAVFKPALQIIKTKVKFHKVSGVFFMVMENRLILFADCAIIPDPNSHDLADIAIDTALTAKRFGLEPKVAMLAFSTNSDNNYPDIQKIKEAIKLARNKNPELLIEGEMQVDAALVPKVAKRKFPESRIAGTANVLIFPNLMAGNIAYKLVERLAGAKAIGPILQGLKKPVNDLSRGCEARDIANIAAITACEAQDIQYGDLSFD
ncbi:phosphate acetyltransferase [Patescibacteria group bacterium]|nr:phosphate acetyltransferase [Patescibacteria group bacterium]MBU1703192.1 phosphate acetyltransferase [Patescibacteria group bacterium]MBU1953524.1 phosphate acetyltransferase [Patescibacteria group bacterium]